MPDLTFERLLPPGPPLGAPALLEEAALRERAPADRPLVHLNMVATLDGRAALNGRTSALGGDADLELLISLRAAADAVLIGSGTLRAEGYARLVQAEERRARRREAGLAEDPVAVLLSRSLDLPWDAGLFAAAGQPVLVYTREGAGPPPATAAPVEVVGLPEPTPAAAFADLRRRGVRALLSESGPTLNRALLAAGLVDELFLTLTPLVTGDEDEPSIVKGGRLPELVGLELVWVSRAAGDLFLRYRVARG